MKKYCCILLSILLGTTLVACSNESKVINSPQQKVQAVTNANNNNYELNFTRDLNNNGTEESMKVTFNNNGDNKITSYNIVITSGDKSYSYEEKNEFNIIPQVKFADFDTRDDYVEFYINWEGESDNPISSIYRFDGSSIKKVLTTVGFVRDYDREGRIYTDFSKTNDKYAVTLSYYDINKAKVQYVDKSILKGKKLQFDNSLILFSDSYIDGKSYLDDNSGKASMNKTIEGYSKEAIVKVCKPNEKLTIIDVDNTNNGNFKEGKERNIRIKVRTEDNKEGWLQWLNGGD